MSDKKRAHEETDDVDTPASVDFLWTLEPKPLTTKDDAAVFVLSTAHTDALCLTGRGRIRCVQTCKHAAYVNGYTLSDKFVYFESPSWSSWATITGLCPSTRIEIASVHSHGTNESGPSFHVHNPRMSGSRSTIIKDTWKTAMDAILEDFSAQQVAQSKQAQLPALFQPSLDRDDSDMPSFRIAVTGAKGVGKSTFLRLLMNQCLSHCPEVALLDLDLGQPELSPPGFVSLSIVSQPLLQPPSTRLYYGQQHSAYFFGAISSEQDPNRYMDCVEQALQDYASLVAARSNQHSQLPLFINCDGFVKGLGETLLQTLMQKLQPTFVVKIVGSLRSQQFEIGELDESVSVLTVDSIVQKQTSATVGRVDAEKAPDGDQAAAVDEPSSPPKSVATLTTTCSCQSGTTALPAVPVPVPLSISAANYRAQRLISYFIRDPALWDRLGFSQDGFDDPSCEIGRRLAAQCPYKVPLDYLSMEFVNPELARDISCLDSILDIVNGSVVGLCCRSPAAETSGGADDESNATKNDAPVPTHLLPCLGLGIVRSIDRINHIMYILSPVPPKLLCRVNVLAIGRIFLPLECYFRGVEAECFPYQGFQWQFDAIGAEPMQSRNSIARKSLIRNA